MASDLPSGLAAAVANGIGAARAQLHASLVSLKDVYGITGSFVCARSGHLVARELPSIFDDAALSEAGSRLTRLQETFASVGDRLEIAVLRFREHKVYVRILPAGTLCIISNAGVNMPALRMAARLVSRRIAPVLDQFVDDPLLGSAAPAVEAPPPPSGRRPPPLAPPGMRRFRGRTVP